MKLTNLILAVSFAALSADTFAGPVSEAAAKMAKNDVRTIITKIQNTSGNPCLPEGKSYSVELQVKHAAYDRMEGKVVYAWETVKTINVTPKGDVTEVCAE